MVTARSRRPTLGRPRLPLDAKRQALHLMLDPEQAAAIKDRATRQNASLSAAAREIIERGLEAAP